jgi:hypothetical protein
VVPSDILSGSPRDSCSPLEGEVWWLSDVLVLVLDSSKSNAEFRPMVLGLTLLDLDGVFDPGEEFEWYPDKLGIHDNELTEQNRRVA